MEAFEKLFALNSDMSAYLPQTDDLDQEETRRLSDKVRAHAKLTMETLEQVHFIQNVLNLYSMNYYKVITAIPDMTEVYNVITKMKKLHPQTGLLEVIGPVFCNTTRHFLLIQVMTWQKCADIVQHQSQKECSYTLFVGPLVTRCRASMVGIIWRVICNDQSKLHDRCIIGVIVTKFVYVYFLCSKILFIPLPPNKTFIPFHMNYENVICILASFLISKWIMSHITMK